MPLFLKKNMLATFINWTDANTSSTIAVIKDLIGDLTPLLIPIIAIGLGLIIFTVIVKAIRGY